MHSSKKEEERIRNGGSIRKANSLTILVEMMANRNAIFYDKWANEQEARGSKGGLIKAASTVGSDHCRTM